MESNLREMTKYKSKFTNHLEAVNLWDFDDKIYSIVFPKDTDIQDIFIQDPITCKIDPSSVKIKTIKWCQDSYRICSLLMEFRDGK